MARRHQVEGRRSFEIFLKISIFCFCQPPHPGPLIEGTGAIQAARQLTRFTSPFNLTGLPALSVPCGFTNSGLPVGLQIIAKHWGEAKILQAGHAFEQATEWTRSHPKI